MSLKIDIPTKQVMFNDKLFNIPKIGLRYYEKLKNQEDVFSSLDIIIKDIESNPSAAEYEYIMLVLSAYNGFLKYSVDYKGNTYHIENILPIKRRKYYIKETEVIFKDEFISEVLNQYDLLKKLCVSHNVDELPAYTINWANELINNIKLELCDKTLIGFSEIQEFFR